MASSQSGPILGGVQLGPGCSGACRGHGRIGRQACAAVAVFRYHGPVQGELTIVHIHIGTDEGGVRNYRAGEYDSCEYFVVFIGIPLFVSFRGCFHVIERAKVRPKERREQLREFVHVFLGHADLAKRTVIPLRPRRDLKLMWFFFYSLFLLGLLSIPGIIFLFLKDVDSIASSIFWTIDVAFLASLLLYLFLLLPSRRQAAIRGVVASRLGPFFDPADWTEDLVARVSPAFGVLNPTEGELLQKAELLLKEGHQEDALVVARMALALPDAFRDRAESVTDECLHFLG